MSKSEATLMDRREKLLAKLEQRNEERKIGNEESSGKSEEAEIEKLMKDIKTDLENKKIDQRKVDSLQEFQTFVVSNRQTKAIQNLLEDVRKLKLTQSTAPKFTGFSFKKPAAAPVKEVPKVEPQSAPFSVNEPSVSENIVEGLVNEKKSIAGTNGEDLSLKNIENCRLQFNFEPSVVHIRNIKNSTLIFRRCDRSLLLNDCENVHIFVAAQQVRIHTSENLHLHIATRGAVILEDSKNVFMYPYRLKDENGEFLKQEDNGEWRTPRDFNWLATTPSPNWKLVPEEEWTEEQLIA